MTRKYVWPACIAAAAHGALLFGVPKSVRPAPPREPVEIIVCHLHPPPVPEEIPEVEVRDPTAFEPRDEPDTPRPPAESLSAGPSVVLTPADRPAILPGDWPEVSVGPVAVPAAPGFGIPGGVVYGGSALDRPPRTRLQPAPLYPAAARRDGRTGTVTVEFLVDETGAVIAPRVASSSDREFEDAALRAVARWRFEPGRREGRIVRFRMSVPIHFSLNE